MAAVANRVAVKRKEHAVYPAILMPNRVSWPIASLLCVDLF